MPFASKTYRIEQGTPGAAPSPGCASAKPEISVELKSFQRALVQELSELKAAIRPLHDAGGPLGAMPMIDATDLSQFRDDIRSVSGSIRETRRQLAAMHVGAPHDIDIRGLHGELDAVVGETSRATNVILDAAEAIRSSAEALRQGSVAPQDEVRLAHIESAVVQVFETCNFQDLTGQRISRVVETLGFIEKRLDRILEIWGGIDAIRSLVADQTRALESERESEGSFGLVSGPQIVGEAGHIDQSGIDALFS